MRPRPLPVLAAGVVALSLLGPVAAVAGDREVTGAAPDPAAEAAGEVLDDAQDVFAGRSPAAARRLLTEGGGDATMALNELMRVRDDLTGVERQRADALLARPTDSASDPGSDGYGTAEAAPVCGDVVCIHYVATTEDAPPLADGDVDGVPDSVEQALATAEQVNDTYRASGYRRPDPDGALGGGADKVDIYLSDVGAQGLYGYCTSDQGGSSFNRWAYCVIDDDFAGFPGTPLENQQVTLAHEYFHAVQFGYDAFEDLWFMEATATWAEDELFNDVDDNRQYLDDGQLGRPGVPLDLFGSRGNHYGNWLFVRRLSERFPAETGVLPKLVLQMWEQASARHRAPDLHSTAAVQQVLAARSSSFRKEYGAFAAANRRPAATYEEGADYPASPVARGFGLGPGGQRTVTTGVRLDHLTHRTYQFTPERTARPDWRLRLDLDLPGRATSPVARLVTYRTDGSVSDSGVRLSRTGAGRVTLGFSTRKIERVELVLVNASRRTRCWRGTLYACQGQPRDNDLRTTFSARTFRS